MSNNEQMNQETVNAQAEEMKNLALAFRDTMQDKEKSEAVKIITEKYCNVINGGVAHITNLLYQATTATIDAISEKPEPFMNLCNAAAECAKAYAPAFLKVKLAFDKHNDYFENSPEVKEFEKAVSDSQKIFSKDKSST